MCQQVYTSLIFFVGSGMFTRLRPFAAASASADRCVSAPCRLFLLNFRSVRRLRRHAKHADVLTVCLQFLIDVKVVKKIPQKYVL